MMKRYMKRCSTSLIREIQFESTVRYYLTPVRMAIIKKTRDNCWRGYDEKGIPSAGGNINWFCHYGKQYRGSLEN